jgi:hypothetical protein
MTDQAKKTPMPMAEKLKRMAAGRQRYLEQKRAKKDAEAEAPARVAPIPDRGATRAPVREAPHEPVHEPQRENGVVMGRDGEVLSRNRKAMGDMFEIPANIVPAGWSYQWNLNSVMGNTDIVLDQGLVMAENGWRPVPAERHPGRFMPAGHKGHILRGGMRLEERPEILTQEALEEERAKALRQVSDRDESLMGRKANVTGAMQGGFEMNRRYRGTGADVKMNIERPMDIPRPKHTLAEPGE